MIGRLASQIAIGLTSRLDGAHDASLIGIHMGSRPAWLSIFCLLVRCAGVGYALGSIEGRVAIEYMDPAAEVQKQRYAFKCHRVKEPASNTEFIYPLHSIAFHEE